MTTSAPLSAHPSGRQQRRRWTVNISIAERVGSGGRRLGRNRRGILLLGRSESVMVVILVLLLIAAGLDLVVTGATGHCPLYQRLGHVPQSLRRKLG